MTRMKSIPFAAAVIATAFAGLLTTPARALDLDDLVESLPRARRVIVLPDVKTVPVSPRMLERIAEGEDLPPLRRVLPLPVAPKTVIVVPVDIDD